VSTGPQENIWHYLAIVLSMLLERNC